MRRRAFITLLSGSAAAPWLIAARALAQQGERMRRIGVLMLFAEDDPESKARLDALRTGLERRGWSEGRNVRLDILYSANRSSQFRPLARELLALRPDVVLAQTAAITAALRRESGTIPIVFVNVSDPIGSRFIATLARPAGNITGVQHYETGITGKWLAMLKEIAPQLTRAALLANYKTISYDYFLRAAQAVAPAQAIELVPGHVETASDIERAIEAIARMPDSGLILPPDATTVVHRNLVIDLATRYRLPAVYSAHFFAAAGGLMSYGADQNDLFRLGAFYLDRILRGDKPANLPVQPPTKYELIINLKTANAVGINVPPTLLARADEVIE